MPYVQIFMVLKRRSHSAAFNEIMATYKIKVEPAPKSIVSENLPLGSDVFRLWPESNLICGHDNCQCSVGLGRQKMQAFDKEKQERKKMGWRQTKMNRWLADIEKDRGYIRETEDRHRWIQWLRDLLANGSVDDIGLLTHESPSEPESWPPIPIVKSMTIPVGQLTPQLLDAMERGILYRFVSPHYNSDSKSL